MAEPNNGNEEKLDNLNDADNFGLPDLDYKPLDQVESIPEENNEIIEAPEQIISEPEVVEEEKIPLPPQPSAPSTAVYGQAEKSNAPVIIAVIISLAIIVGAVVIYLYVYKPAADEKARREQLAAEELKRQKAAAAALKAQQEEEERKRKLAEQQAAVAPVEGTIESLSARMGRYHVVVSSAIDGDLIMDYAKKLSSNGISSKIIPPFGKWKFYRLSLGDYESFDEAQASADAFKEKYGEGVWVIKY
jgi:hypothetical protein